MTQFDPADSHSLLTKQHVITKFVCCLDLDSVSCT